MGIDLTKLEIIIFFLQLHAKQVLIFINFFFFKEEQINWVFGYLKNRRENIQVYSQVHVLGIFFIKIINSHCESIEKYLKLLEKIWLRRAISIPQACILYTMKLMAVINNKSFRESGYLPCHYNMTQKLFF